MDTKNRAINITWLSFSASLCGSIKFEGIGFGAVFGPAAPLIEGWGGWLSCDGGILVIMASFQTRYPVKVGRGNGTRPPNLSRYLGSENEGCI